MKPETKIRQFLENLAGDESIEQLRRDEEAYRDSPDLDLAYWAYLRLRAAELLIEWDAAEE